jgi:hypothetical protein
MTKRSSAGVGRGSHESPMILLHPLRRDWMMDVGWRLFGVHHKHPEYNSPSAAPWGWSGGTLDKPWTCPGTIEPSPTPVFDQPHLSSPLHPPLRRLRSARADGVLPVAPRCSRRLRCGRLSCFRPWLLRHRFGPAFRACLAPSGSWARCGKSRGRIAPTCDSPAAAQTPTMSLSEPAPSQRLSLDDARSWADLP